MRLARSPDEVRAAQRLRHEVFHVERGAHGALDRLDRDRYDETMDHIVVLDPDRTVADGHVVGTYRVRVHGSLASAARGYAAREFDLSMLEHVAQPLLELGRSCVLAPYRTRGVINLLWREIGRVVALHRIGLMFGCASIAAEDMSAAYRQLAYLHRHHLAPVGLRPRAHGPGAVEVEPADDGAPAPELEPLIKGYLRLGAYIGEGAYVDHAFNCIDTCIVLPTERLTMRSVRRYRPVADEVQSPVPAVAHAVAGR
ncbi:GNAT family N-acetyltransferase [Lysobacter xanthus]